MAKPNLAQTEIPVGNEIGRKSRRRLRGRVRARPREVLREQRRVVAIGTRPETLRLPESAMLARIGRRDLWERPREGMEA